MLPDARGRVELPVSFFRVLDYITFNYDIIFTLTVGIKVYV
jgi:hypothetical protein